MTQPEQNQSPPEQLRTLAQRMASRAPNASALPIGPMALNLLLRDTITSHEFRSGLETYAEECLQIRLVVADIYRRLSPTQRFRLHSSLMSGLQYVPTWLREITS